MRHFRGWRTGRRHFCCLTKKLRICDTRQSRMGEVSKMILSQGLAPRYTRVTQSRLSGLCKGINTSMQRAAQTLNVSASTVSEFSRERIRGLWGLIDRASSSTWSQEAQGGEENCAILPRGNVSSVVPNRGLQAWDGRRAFPISTFWSCGK